MKDIRRPFLNVYCEQDTIVPAAASVPLTDLVGSRDATALQLKSGHIGLIVGREASKVARPQIADWIRRHSSERKRRTKAA